MKSTPGQAASVFIHDRALVETDTIGSGTRIWAFAHVMAGAAIGEDCQICDHVFLESGCRIGRGVTIKNNALVWEGVTIGDYAFIGPHVVFTNDRYPRSPRHPEWKERLAVKRNWLVETVVEEGASLGANAVILCGVRLGRYCLVAAGSVVTHDVPPHGLVAGNPARFIGYVGHSGRRLRETPEGWIEPFSGTVYRLNEGKMERSGDRIA